MKLQTLLLVLPVCSAFVQQQPHGLVTTGRAFSALQAVELEAEPEGGDELSQSGTTMPGCRMKEMKESDKKSDDGQVYQFWMTAEADGALIKEFRTEILKNAKKKANFPGFRKGQVPPYAMPQITQFSLQEAIIKTVEAAVETYGLKSLAGSDGEVEVHEDVKKIGETYKLGDSVAFTATLDACYDPEKAKSEPEDAGVAVDVEAEETA